MFNNLKLAVKIGGGFLVVVALTVSISTLNVLSLRNLKAMSYKNDTTSLIVQTMQTGTVAGKNFVITKLDAHRGEVQSSMEKIVEMASALQKLEKNKDQLSALSSIIAGAEEYKKYFNDYARYESEKTGKETEMIEQALRLEAALDELHGRLPGRADFVSRMIVLLYKARISVNKYILYKDGSSIQATQTYMGDLRTLAISLRNSVYADADRKSIDDIVLLSETYGKNALDYVTLCTDQEGSRVKAADGGALTIKNATVISDSAAADMGRLFASSTVFMIVVAIIAALFAVVLAVFITRSITGAMKKGVDFALQISEGDLSVALDIDQKDEIGMLANALRAMLTKLSAIVMDVNSVARQVAAGSQQLSSTSQEMSQGATEQASSVEEISSSMEQMTSNIKQNADNAMQTEKIAQKSAASAEEGGRAVADTVNAMKEIASKIGIIEEIARSTNMLALNASIEAARAGEYGKGFAVVASEVGKLAERSQKEAGEISKLSTESVAIAERAGTTISAMIPDIKRTAELVQEISAASNEQNSGAEQINSAIMQLDQVVQQNASASEESASMAEELASQAEQMQASMEFFRIGSDPQAPVARKAIPVSAQRPQSPTTEREPVSAASGAGGKKRAQRAKSAGEDVPRQPLSGINLVLDDDASGGGRDAMDKDFQEF